MKIAFIGLGSIGHPMARNLVKAGHAVTVHDLDRSRAADLLDMGAAWADSPAEAVAGAEALMTSLPGPKQVEAVMSDAGPTLRPGSIWCDLTTSDLKLTKALSAELAKLGVATLEAPITGGIANARIGKITIFVSGPREAYERMQPVLHDIAMKVFHFGDLGGATVVKLITNQVAFIYSLAFGEGLVLGRKYGLDQVELIEAMKASYADSFLVRTDASKILSGDYATDFSMALAYKDLTLTRGLASELGLHLAGTDLMDVLFKETLERYGDDVGSLGHIRLLEEKSGVSLPIASA